MTGRVKILNYSSAMTAGKRCRYMEKSAKNPDLGR